MDLMRFEFLLEKIMQSNMVDCDSFARVMTGEDGRRRLRLGLILEMQRNFRGH